MIDQNPAHEFLIFGLPIFFLYAEIHYKIPGIPSKLFRRLPEIIADVPFRLEPDQNLPILMIIKDAHQFPIVLEKIWCVIRKNNENIETFSLWNDHKRIQSDWWEQIFYIERDQYFENTISVDVFIQIKKNRKRYIFQNHNYKHATSPSFQIRLAQEKLPLFPNQYSGDLHVHSNYTSDQVEFGASLHATKQIAKAIGFSFFAITDHSYDLDDFRYNYLRTDQELNKWKKLQSDVEHLNANQDSVPVWIIPGEEISVRNHDGRNVHLLLLNEDKFYPGSGDSGEKWLQHRSHFSVEEIVENIKQSSLAVAPHPLDMPPFLEYNFLHRGHWGKNDLRNGKLSGLQILNGYRNKAFYRGLNQWRQLLLQGKKSLIYAGNDAHGNFNAYRQIKIPFWSIKEDSNYIFGNVRTVVLLQEEPTLQSIVAALKKGNCYITNGPAMTCMLQDEQGKNAVMGQNIRAEKLKFFLDVLSSSEFGTIQKVNIYHGDLAHKKETLYKKYTNSKEFVFQTEFSFTGSGNGYFRVEIETLTEDKQYYAYSNPIWFGSDIQ